MAYDFQALQCFQLVLLLLAANGAPLLAGHYCSHLQQLGLGAIDRGNYYHDGHRILGDSKTWLGLLASIVATLLIAGLLQFPLVLALAIALLAMLGDLISSFSKRRLHFRSGFSVPGLDQLPESLLPALVIGFALNLSLLTIALTVLGFILIHIILTEILAALHFHPKLH